MNSRDWLTLFCYFKAMGQYIRLHKLQWNIVQRFAWSGTRTVYVNLEMHCKIIFHEPSFHNTSRHLSMDDRRLTTSEIMVWNMKNKLHVNVIGFNHGFPWCVKYMARGPRSPQNPTATPEGFVATGGPRAMYFTHHGKPWLKHNIARPLGKIWYKTVVTLHKWSQQRRQSTTAIDDGTSLGLAVLGKRQHP